jgi:hypothetical protein
VKLVSKFYGRECCHILTVIISAWIDCCLDGIFLGEGTSVLASVVPQSIQQQLQQPLSGRPTQQVQPVPSHFEEATGNCC